jgi:hypothetical protein
MNRLSRLARIGIAGVLLVGILAACQGGSDATDQVNIQQTLAALNQTATAIEQRVSELTAIAPAGTTPQPTEIVPAATDVPQISTLASSQTPLPPTRTQIPVCLVQQDLNVRPGPGRAYEPIIAILPEGTSLTANAYNPDGFPPGGPWARVQTQDASMAGWVSALPAYIVCNFDLTSLPPAQVTPPAAWADPLNQSLDDGNFQNFPNVAWNVVFSPAYFLQIALYDKNYGTRNGNGIDHVEFTVFDAQGNQVYQKVESNARYCAFGGDSPCSPWVIVNGRLYWGQGGPEVKEGKYTININAITADGGDLMWVYTVFLDLPY